ncbi:hypothetical protein [Haloglycomyces albus]|uniref:hypothetical protein n=1 Tax=Haloglycomyces albus TaxID=526067 RepID=UPI00046D476C|nr:hypothetical protein [Haloglycomyces albus]
MSSKRSREVEQYWKDLGIDPIAVTVNHKTGYTLRAYRMSDTLPNWSGNLSDPPVSDEPEDESNPEPQDIDFSANDAEPEEVPVMLVRKGELLLFEEPEALVDYVKANDGNQLDWLDEYEELQKTLTVEHIAPAEEDEYELSGVVSELRRGTWKTEDLIAAGEFSRDAAYVLDLDSVTEALDPGSPLDVFDNFLRDSLNGGLRGMRAKRRIKRQPTEQTAIAWRAVISKISERIQWG